MRKVRFDGAAALARFEFRRWSSRLGNTIAGGGSGAKTPLWTVDPVEAVPVEKAVDAFLRSRPEYAAQRAGLLRGMKARRCFHFRRAAWRAASR